MIEETQDVRIAGIRALTRPCDLLEELQIGEGAARAVARGREQVRDVLTEASNLSIHVAWPGSNLYEAGRALAGRVYRSVWQTHALSGEHALGVVAFEGSVPVGNVNLYVPSDGGPLPSERYFEPAHWQPYFDVSRTEIGEVAALAIDSERSFDIRELTLLGLMYGLCVAGCMLGLRLLSTVERRPLARRIRGYLGLPLIQNDRVTEPSADVPDDLYWRGDDKPQLYYLDMRDPASIRATGMIHAYLTSKAVTLRAAPPRSGSCRTFVGFVEELKQRHPCAGKSAGRVDAA